MLVDTQKEETRGSLCRVLETGASPDAALDRN